MSDKMQVLFIKQTGHVMAAFTRATDPEDKPAVSALVGSGLLVRNQRTISAPTSGGETFSIPGESLDVSVVDFDPDVFLLPSIFAAGGGKVESLGSVVPSSIALDPDKLTITVAGAAPSDLKVWAQVEKVITPTDSEPVTRVMTGIIEKTKNTADLILTISPGGTAASIPPPSTSRKYFILALVEGQLPLFSTKP